MKFNNKNERNPKLLHNCNVITVHGSFFILRANLDCMQSKYIILIYKTDHILVCKNS